MRSLFSDLYLYTEAGDISLQARSMNEEDREQDPRVKRAREMLRTSDAFLSTIEKYLRFDWDIDDDGSLDPTEPGVGPSASRNRRKRKAEDYDCSERNIHLKRIGRMSPRSNPRSVDEVSSQTSSCHDNIFSISSRGHSSSGDHLSSSLRSGNDDLSAKQ